MTELKRPSNLREPTKDNVELGDLVVTSGAFHDFRLLPVVQITPAVVFYRAGSDGWSASGSRPYNEVVILKKSGEYLVGSNVDAYELQSEVDATSRA